MNVRQFIIIIVFLISIVLFLPYLGFDLISPSTNNNIQALTEEQKLPKKTRKTISKKNTNPKYNFNELSKYERAASY